MQRLPRFLLALSFLLYVSFCGCDTAQSKSVPSNFSFENFERIIDYAQDNYIDPGSINKHSSYVGAAESALKALPYPLMLLPRSYYDKRNEILTPEKVIPGKAVEIDSDLPYLVFVPDYVELEKQSDEFEKREELRRKKLTQAQKSAELIELRERSEKQQKILEDAWNDTGFEFKDFRKVIEWTEANMSNYSTLPSNYKGEDPFKENPFGLNHIFFAATNGYLQAMDPHTSVIDQESWDKIRRESQDSSFEGIGALLRGGGNQEVIVETPLPGSPALKSGLKAGDVIRKVDGKSIDNLLLSEVVKRIRGPRDTIVVLHVDRKSELTSLDVKIKRGLIVQKAVSSQYIPEEKIGIIKLSSFLFDNEPPTRLVIREYENLKTVSNNQMEGLVLDLRNNPGGDLEEAINVSGLFVNEGDVVVRIQGRGEQQVRKSDIQPLDLKIPVIVLINSGSASASEIVASALMDHDSALIVGERSFGKASVQELRPRGDVFIKLTKSRYYAPDGYTVQVYGVEPDIKISEELDGSFPPQFREENMWKHLPELQKRKLKPKRQEWINALKVEAGDVTKVEKYLENHKNDALKPDYMLMRAIPYLKAMRKLPSP